MVLNLYFGKNVITHQYYLNTRGEDYIEKEEWVFENIDSLLREICRVYKSRKVEMILSPEFSKEEREKILSFIEKNSLKFKLIRHTLTDKI